jgi:tetratricopeptide (TPR) repeat protein
VNRRTFFGAVAAASCTRPSPLPAARFPVRYRKTSPYEGLYQHIEPGHDEFASEREAMDIPARLERILAERRAPLAPDFRGVSPHPKRYAAIAEDVAKAEFDSSDAGFEAGLTRWIESLGAVNSARFYALADNLVRFEIAGSSHYRVGLWRLSWSGASLKNFEPIEETRVTASRPLFRDITAHAFAGCASFREQLLRGVPHWRARLDSATGIDVYGNNGIAVGDIDGDGVDEIYVCQPAGLPNRLYKNRGGHMQDITERAGLDVLDDTASALFVDFRNTGRQDLVVLRATGPLLFLNQGDGTFREKPDAFRFRTPPQGTFTGMAAADYDRDGRVDLYLCCYIYFQSEDQYRYPAPYHDAQNGPPNFLFRNQLSAEGGGFEDVTTAAGLNQNNNRYSFAAAWCDYDGDGWPSLYVANDFGRNNLYKNEGGRFRDVAAEAGVEDLGPGMSAAWFDYDGDGRPDLYVSNMWTAAGQRITRDPAFSLPSGPYRRHAKGNTLFRNRGGGTFEETGEAEMGRWAWSADAYDFDNDGSPEIYVACGMLTNSSPQDLSSFFWRQVVARSPLEARPEPAYENGWNALNQLIREDYSWNGREPNVFYARRNGRYYDFSGVSGLDFADDSRAFTVTDIDGDGNLDVLLKSRLGPQVRVLRNECGARRPALAIHLRGTASNRDAIGARAELGAQVKSVQAGSGYLSQSTKTLYFGSPDARNVRIRWPSGKTQQFTNLEPGFVYDIEEGSTQFKRTPFTQRGNIAESPPVQPDNQPQSAETWLFDPIPLPVPREGPGILRLTAEQLGKEPEQVIASFALFRRYLFDWRTDLELPCAFLLDERGMARKFYPGLPAEKQGREDLAHLAEHARLALPFPGKYYSRPSRNYFRLGAAFLNAGYPAQALPYLNEALRRSPENVSALLAVSQIHLEAGRHREARPLVDRALALRPDSAEAWNNLGGAEMAAGDAGAALRDYEKALALRPDMTHAMLNAADAYTRLRQPAQAEAMLRRAAKADPRDAEAANQLGLLLAKEGRSKEAREWFQQAIALRKNFSGAINNLGVLYMQLEQPNDAIAAFQYGIEVAPQEDILYVNLAKVYARLGEGEKAKSALRQLLDLKPDHGAARQALQELEKR